MKKKKEKELVNLMLSLTFACILTTACKHANIVMKSITNGGNSMNKFIKVLSASTLATIAGVSLTACSTSATETSTGSIDKLIIWADPQDMKFIEKMDSAIKATGVKEVVVKEVLMLDQIKNYDKVSAEEEPDIITIPHDKIGEVSTLGYIKPTSASINDKIEGDTVKSNLMFNNESYGAVKSMETLVLYYDKTAFPEAPTSLDVFTSGDKKVTSNFSDGFFSWMFSAGYDATIFDDNQAPKKVTMNSDESVKGLEYMKKLTDNRGKELTDDNALADFTAKRAQAYISGPWDAEKVGDAGIIPLPKMSDDKSPKPFLNTKTWQMTKKGDANKEMIEKVLSSFISEDAAKARLETSKEVLPVQGVDFSASELSKALSEQVKNTVPNPNVPQIAGFWDPFANAIKKTLYNGEDAKSSLDEAANTFATSQKLEVA